MKRLIQTLCLVIAFTSLAAGQTFSRKPWSYLKADANDTARILTNDKTDTLPISHDGNNWWIGDGDTTWFDNHIVYIGNVDSSGGNVMLIFKNAVDSFGIRLNSGANGEYTNDFNTWNEFGTGGSGSSIPVFEDNTQKEDALQRLKFGSDFDVTLTTNDTTKVTLESHLESVAASADSLDRKVYMQGDTMMPTATHNLYLGDQQSKTAIAVTAYKVDTTDAGAEYVTQDELSAATSVGVNDSITKYAIRKDGSNSPTAAVSWGSQNLTTVNALGVTKIKLAADADTVQSLANSANDGLIITAQNLKVSADSTNFAANTIGSTDLNNADVFQFGGLGLNTTKSTSWALLIQSLRKEGGYNGIAIQDTAKDSMVGINLYAYNAAGTQQSGGIYLNPGNTPLTQAYWSFKLPTTFTKDDYDKLRIYADSVQMRTYVSLIPSARIAGGWLEMDTIYMGTVPLWHDTTIASEGELEDSLDNYYNATTIQAAIEDSLDNYYNATTIQAAIEDSLDNYYNQTAIAAGFFSTADFDNETIDTTAAGKLRVIGAGTAKNADTLGHVAYMQGDTIMGSYYYGDQQSKTAAAVGMYEKDTTNANAKYSTNAEVDTVIEDSLDNYLLLGDTANQLRTNRVDTIPTNVVNTAYPWADDEVADNITASGYLTLGDTVNQVRTNRVDTITANLVNTAYPWADNEVADNITAGHATTADTADNLKSGFNLTNPNFIGDATLWGDLLQPSRPFDFDFDYVHAELTDSNKYILTVPIYAGDSSVCDMCPGAGVNWRYFNDSGTTVDWDVYYIPQGWPFDDPTDWGDDSCIWIPHKWWAIYTPYCVGPPSQDCGYTEWAHIAYSEDGYHWFRPFKIDTASAFAPDTIYASQPLWTRAEAETYHGGASPIDASADPSLLFYSDAKMYASWVTGDDVESSWVMNKASINGVDWDTLHVVGRKAISVGCEDWQSPSWVMGNFDSVYVYTVRINADGDCPRTMLRYRLANPNDTIIGRTPDNLDFYDTTYGGRTRWTIPYWDDEKSRNVDTVVYDSTYIRHWVPVHDSTLWYPSRRALVHTDTGLSYIEPWHPNVKRFNGKYYMLNHEAWTSAKDTFPNGPLAGTHKGKAMLCVGESEDGLRFKFSRPILFAKQYQPPPLDWSRAFDTSLIVWDSVGHHWAEDNLYAPMGVFVYDQLHGWYIRSYIAGKADHTTDTSACPPPAKNTEWNIFKTGIVNIYFNKDDYQEIQFTAFAPDAINDTIAYWYCDPGLYPDGVRMDKIWAGTRDNTHSGYTLKFQEYTAAAAGFTYAAYIDTLTIHTDSSYTQSNRFNHSLIEAGHYVRMIVPSTDVAFIWGGMRICRRDLDLTLE